MSLAFSRGDIWNRGNPKRGALASWCACVRSCGVPAFSVGTMAIPKESAVDTNSETASSYAIGGAMTRARTTALLNFSQCKRKRIVSSEQPAHEPVNERSVRVTGEKQSASLGAQRGAVVTGWIFWLRHVSPAYLSGSIPYLSVQLPEIE